MPMTVPPLRLAPRAAASGNPGHAPVMTMQSVSAMASPNTAAFSRWLSGTLSPAPPMTPSFRRIWFGAGSSLPDIPTVV